MVNDPEAQGEWPDREHVHESEGMMRIPILGRRKEYWQRIRALFGSSLIGYWPLWETSGTVARDYSGNGRDGAYSGISPGGGTSTSGRNCLLHGGSAGLVDLESLKSVINNQEGTYICNAMVSSAADWTTGLQGRLFYYLIDGSNYLQVNKSSSNNTFVIQANTSGTYTASSKYLMNTGWMQIIASWSVASGKLCLWVNGSKIIDLAGFTAMTGAASKAYIGSALGSNYWKGLSSDHLLLSKAISDIEALTYQKITPFRKIRAAFIGDSITAESAEFCWPIRVAGQTTTAMMGVFNHAVSGATVLGGSMQTQCIAAANDNADIVIIAIGANDNDAGDMNAYRAEYVANIDRIKASNPMATIYAINAWKGWTATDGVTERVHTNVRTATVLACADRNITLFDPYTTPWFAANETSDGVHPIAAGHAKIAAQVLARI